MADGVLKTVPTDGMGDGAFMFGINDQNLSNEVGVLKAHAGVEYPAGTVLGLAASGGDAGKLKPIDPAAADGSQNFAGILYARQEANAADKRVTFVARRQGVIGNFVSYVNAVTAPQRKAIEAQAAAAGVIFRY